MLDNYELQQLNNLKFSNPELYGIFRKMENDFLSFASRACHDIRNCNALIDNYCQLISERSPDITNNAMWSKIVKNTHSSIQKLNDISAYRYSFNMDNYSLITLQEIISHIQKSHPGIIKINIKTQLTEFYGVRENILYALEALILNSKEASLHSCEYYIQLDISNEENILHFTFTDNGSGFEENIPESDAVSPFYSSKGNHTGLGLSTAYNTAVRHGGSLVIKNPGNPTIIDFFLKTGGIA